MASKDQDRMLEVLRSLTPPRAPSPAEDAPAPAAPRRGRPAAAGEPLARAAEGVPPPGADSASPAEAAAPAAPVASSRPARDGKIIQLRVEEVGVFFLAGMVLVVMAFLMGWYGRGTGAARLSSPKSVRLAADARAGPSGERGLSAEAAHGPAPSLDASPGPSWQLNESERDLGVRPSGIASAGAPSGATYSILVARFPLGGAGEAEDHRRSLKQRGYPGWLRRTAEGIELCVGRFDSPADRLARQWRPKLRKLSPVYSSTCIVRIP